MQEILAVVRCGNGGQPQRIAKLLALGAVEIFVK